MKLRRYLLTSLLGLTGAMMSLSSVSLANEATPNTYTDGVYEGSAKGYADGVTTVKVTVEGGVIKNVEVLSHGDTPMFYDMAAPTVIQNIIDRNTPDVDAVSNASFSSYGIMNAVKDALGKSKESIFNVHNWKELQNAVSKAQDGDTITLVNDITDAGVVDSVASSTLTINKAITINGNDKTITPAQDAHYAFYVLGTNGARIHDLKIKDAYFDKKQGGGLYVKGESHLTLDRVHFINNTAGRVSDRNAGGAIFADNHGRGIPTVIINDSHFENNKVIGADGKPGKGGAIAAFNANVTVNNSYFSNNSGGYGGAIAAYGNETTLTVTNSTFEANNDGSLGGDDIYIFDGYTWLRNRIQLDSKVNVTLENNTHLGSDGSDFTGYRVVRGRILGEMKEDPYNEVLQFSEVPYTGAASFFRAGHDLVFPKTETTRAAMPVDLTSLYAALDRAKAISNQNYTDETWEALQTLLPDAESYLLNPADPTLAAGKEEAIIAAINALKVKPSYAVVEVTLGERAKLVESPIIPQIKKATYLFKIDAPMNEIASVKLNGQSLSVADFSLNESSVIALSKEKVDMLTPGDYTLVVGFASGQETVLKFKIEDKPIDTPKVEENIKDNLPAKDDTKNDNASKTPETTADKKDKKKSTKKKGKGKAPKTSDTAPLVMSAILATSTLGVGLLKKKEEEF